MTDPGLEQAALDSFYRVEREWRVIASGTAWMGAGAIWVGWRPFGIVLIVMSLLCQALSWRAMRGALRLEKERLVRLWIRDPVERWKGQS